MKQKITLLSLMLLISAFTFGQNASEKNRRLLPERRLEKRLNTSYLENNKINPRTYLPNNRLNAQSNMLKSTQASKQSLDSLIWQYWDESTSQWSGYEKYLFSYDANGNRTKYINIEWWETTSEWVPEGKVETTYDENSILKQSISYGWWDEHWNASSKEEYTYDANDNMTQKMFYSWQSSQWNAYEKKEYTYDANGNITQEIHYEWDESISDWVPIPNNWDSSKCEYTYNADGNITQEICYRWDESNSQWIVLYKVGYGYEYDANGNMIQLIGYNWSESSSQWVASSKEEFTYDANGNMTQEIPYEWDNITNQWIHDLNKYKTEYTYDVDGNMTQYVNYSWNNSLSQLVRNRKLEYTYDANGNRINIIKYNWHESTSQWVVYKKEENTYDNAFSFNDLILPYVYFYSDIRLTYNHMLTNAMCYEKDATDNWTNYWRQLFFYSEQNVTGVNDLETAIVGLYPNPVSEYLNFSFKSNSNSATFELFDSQGRKLISKKISNNEQLNLEYLNSGLYLYNLYIDGNKQSGKLIKE